MRTELNFLPVQTESGVEIEPDIEQECVLLECLCPKLSEESSFTNVGLFQTLGQTFLSENVVLGLTDYTESDKGSLSRRKFLRFKLLRDLQHAVFCFCKSGKFVGAENRIQNVRLVIVVRRSFALGAMNDVVN